jgi:hypothetical protein
MATSLLGKFKFHLHQDLFLTELRCAFNIPEQRILVDLDAERGRQPQPGRENKVYCLLRPTKPIRMAVIQGYLSGYMQFDNTILEAISEFSKAPHT